MTAGCIHLCTPRIVSIGELEEVGDTNLTAAAPSSAGPSHGDRKFPRRKDAVLAADQDIPHGQLQSNVISQSHNRLNAEPVTLGRPIATHLSRRRAQLTLDANTLRGLTEAFGPATVRASIGRSRTVERRHTGADLEKPPSPQQDHVGLESPPPKPSKIALHR